jgi:glycosyltransferase involved in cell wall biosynthesis
MHYCFLLTFGSKSAASFRMRQLGAALIERGVRVSYILNDDGEGRSATLPKAAEVELIRPGSPFKMMLARRRAVRRLRPDYVEVLNPHVQTLLPLAGLRGIRVVGLWDEPIFLHDLGRATLFLSRLWNRWLLRRAWMRIVASRALQELLRTRHGVDSTYLPHVTYMDRHEDGASPFDKPTVVYVGTLYPVWDQDLVFAAAEELARRGVPAGFCVIGTGSELEQWRSFVRDRGLNHVRVTGFLSEAEMWRHMRHAHALLFPMRPSALNRSRCSSKLFAYAQSRRPVIANRVGEAPEILGDHPTWVEPTAAAFADAVAAVTAGPRPPDVAYDLDRLSPATRAGELLAAIARREAEAGEVPGARRD